MKAFVTGLCFIMASALSREIGWIWIRRHKARSWFSRSTSDKSDTSLEALERIGTCCDGIPCVVPPFNPVALIAESVPLVVSVLRSIAKPSSVYFGAFCQGMLGL